MISFGTSQKLPHFEIEFGFFPRVVVLEIIFIPKRFSIQKFQFCVKTLESGYFLTVLSLEFGKLNFVQKNQLSISEFVVDQKRFSRR